MATSVRLTLFLPAFHSGPCSERLHSLFMRERRLQILQLIFCQPALGMKDVALSLAAFYPR